MVYKYWIRIFFKEFGNGCLVWWSEWAGWNSSNYMWQWNVKLYVNELACKVSMVYKYWIRKISSSFSEVWIDQFGWGFSDCLMSWKCNPENQRVKTPSAGNQSPPISVIMQDHASKTQQLLLCAACVGTTKGGERQFLPQSCNTFKQKHCWQCGRAPAQWQAHKSKFLLWILYTLALLHIYTILYRAVLKHARCQAHARVSW